MADDNNILQLMKYVTDQGDEGRKSGLQELLGRAYSAPAADRQNILATVAARGEPGMAVDAQKQFSAQDDDIHDRIIQRAGMVSALYKTNPQMAAAAYQGLPQMAAQAGFGQVPAQLDDKVAAALDNMSKLALSGKQDKGVEGVQSTYIDNNGQRVAVMRDGTKQILGANAPNNQIIGVPNAQGGVDYSGINKTTLQAAPVITGGAAPQQAPQAPPGVVIDPSLPPDIKASIAAHPDQWAQAPDGSTATIPPPQGQQLSGAPKPQAPRAPSALDERIALARSMGASADQIKAMVMGGANGQGEASVPGDQSKTGDPYLSTLPQQQAAQVKALADGRMAFPTGTALKSPYWQGMLSAVSQYDPNFDAVNYNARAKTRADFTSGKSANNVKALNTLAGHIAGLQVAVNNLGGTDFPIYNTVRNTALSATGDTRLSTLNAAKTAVANELTTAFRGSGGAEADVQGWLKQLDEAKSPGQLNASIKEIGGLVKSRIEALQEQYTQGMGTTKANRPFVTPKNERFFNDLLGGQPQQQPTAAGGWSATRVK